MAQKPSDIANDAASLQIDIVDDLMVMPIPATPLPSNFTSVWIAISNPSNCDRWVYALGILPELFDSSIEPIPFTLLPPNNQYASCYEKVRPSTHPMGGISRGVRFRLVWQDSNLNLEFWNSICDQKLIAVFADLQAGEYLLSFRYCLPSGLKWKSTPLKTGFKVLRLIQPDGDNPGSIEVNGIQFEAIVPEQILIPAQLTESNIPVEFVFQIRNCSSTPHLFLLFALMPELQDARGKALKRDYAVNASYNPRESDFRLLQPGESLEYSIKGEFYWYKNQLYLRGYENSGGCWHFEISEDQYWLRVTYITRRWNREPKYCEENTWQLHQEMWEGFVSTPVKKFELITSR